MDIVNKRINREPGAEELAGMMEVGCCCCWKLFCEKGFVGSKDRGCGAAVTGATEAAPYAGAAVAGAPPTTGIGSNRLNRSSLGFADSGRPLLSADACEAGVANGLNE